GDGQQGDDSGAAIQARVFDANGVAQNPNPITEDVVTSIDTATLLGNDRDVDGDALTMTAVSATSTHGATLTLNTDGTISYDPTGADAVQALAEGQSLTDTFTYTVEDGNGGQSTATVSVVVHGANDAPVLALALPNQSSAEDEAVSFVLPENAFTDVDGDALTLSVTLVDGSALPGWLVFDAVAGNFSGTPPQDFNGILSVKVTASDGSLSESGTFALEISPVNDAPVAADDIVGPSEFLINEFTNSSQVHPSVTALANGNFVVTWQSDDGQQGDTDSYAIKARILNENGVEIVSEFQVNEFTNDDQMRPSVMALTNGHFVVTWASNDGQQGDADWAIKARIFDENGVEIVSEFLVNEFTDGRQGLPSVTALADGQFAVSWESFDQQQGDTDLAIKARIFDATGSEIVSEFLVNEATDGPQTSPSVAALANGYFIVTWRSAEQGGTSDGVIKARIFDATGNELVSEFLVNEFTNGDQRNPSVTALEDGKFVVTWQSYAVQQGDPSGYVVKARIFDANGDEVVSEFVVNEYTNSWQVHPSITALTNGHFVVTWASKDAQQGDDGYAVKARIFDATGAEIVSEFLVNEVTYGHQWDPSVTALANGGFVVTWESGDQKQGDASSAIKARIFDANGVAQNPTPITEDAVTLIETATLLANDSDVDGDVLTVAAVSATSAHGAALTLNTDGTISYDPTGADAVQALAEGQTLTDIFTYTVDDGNGGQSTASVSVVVHGANDAPVLALVLPPQSSAEDEAVSFALPANAFTDVDGDALTLSATLTDGSALPGWLVFDAVAGRFSGTPSQDFNGVLSVTVTASDGFLSASSAFALEITPVNDAPVAADDVAQSPALITEDAVTLIETATLLANDSDVEGDALTVTAVSATSANGATLTLNTDGTISYDPTSADAVQALAEGQALVDTFTYTVDDGNGGQSTATVFIVVHGTNDAPVVALRLEDQSSAEDEAVSFALPANAFTDVDGDALTLSATLTDGAALPDWLVFDAVAGSFSGTPPQDFHGTLSVTVTASDGALSESGSFALEITPVNDAPVAALALSDQSSKEDEAVSFALPANAFTDVDADALTLSATLTDGAALPDWLVFDAVAGSFSGTPPQDFNGILSVTVTARDGYLSASSAFALEITPVNDAPVAVDDVAQSPAPITEDTVISIDIATLLANDSDVEGDALTMTAVSATSAHDAALTLNTDGTISYDPTGAEAVQALAEGQTLTDTFTDTVSDGNGGVSVATVSVVVRGTNDAPVQAIPLPDQSSAEDEAVSFALPANAFTDVDGDTLTLSATLVGGAALPDWLVFDAASGSFSGTPPQDFNGMLSVTVTASDGSLSASDTFALEITPVNDAPVAVNDVAQNPAPITEDGVTSIDIATLLANDSDVEGDALTVTEVSDTSAHGATLTLNTNGTISYDPTGADAVQALAEGETLADTFTYTVADGNGGENTATVLVVVHGTNDAPVLALALEDQSSAEDTAVSFALPANAFTDVDGDVLTLSATLTDGAALPDWLVFDAVVGSFSGTPPQDFNGMLSVTVTASDGSLTASDTFVLEITPVNDAPVAADDVAQSPASITEDTVISIDIATLLANDSDIDGDALTMTAVSATSTHGATLTLNTDGTISYDPTSADAVQTLAIGQTLTDTFTYTVDDGNGGESTASVSIVVHGTNDAPVAVDDVAQSPVPVTEDVVTLIETATLLANDSDVDGDALTVTAVSATSTHGATLTLNPDGTISYDPTSAEAVQALAQGQALADTFTHTVDDGNGGQSTATVFIIVRGTNDAPVLAIALEDQSSAEDEVVSFALPANVFTDVDGDALTLTATLVGGAALPGWLVFDAAAGSFSGTPPQDFNGTLSVTVTASDGSLTASSAFALEITPVNDAPVLAIQLEDQSSAEDAATSFTLPANAFTDVDGDALTLSATLTDGTALPGWLVFDAAAGSFSGTPPQDFYGIVSVTVTASDGSLSESGTFALDVTPVNDAPVAAIALFDQSSAEDEAVSFTLPANAFTDVDGDELSLSATLTDGAALPDWLVFDAALGSFSGTPPQDFNGILGVTVTASDGSLTASDTFALEITPVNDAPSVADDTVTQSPNIITEDAVTLIDITTLLANDSDVEGDALTMTAVSATSTYGAALVLNTNGTFSTISYDPRDADAVQALAEGQTLTDTFTYTVSDGNGGESTATVSVVVHGTNDAPVVAIPLLPQSSAEDEVVSFALPANAFTDVEGDALTLNATLAGGAALPGWLVFDAVAGSFSGTPPQDFNGSLAVMVTASDGSLTASDTFALEITPVNDAPVAAIALFDQSSAEDEAVSFTLPANAFTDVDGDELTLTATLTDGTALPDWLVFDTATASFSGTPPQDFNGILSVTVTASDGSLAESDTFALEITPVNDAPVAADDVAQSPAPVTEDGVTVIDTATLLANDSDVEGDVLTVTDVSATSAQGASLVLNTDGTISYDPTGAAAVQALAEGQTLTDTFTYTVADGNGGESTATVSIVVHGTNDAPVLAIALLNQFSAEDAAVSFTLPANAFTDVDGDALTLSATLVDGTALPDWLVFDAAAGSFSGTPPQDFNGHLAVTVTASDGSLSASDTFALDVAPVNDAPVVSIALEDQASAEDEAVSFALPANAFTDVDGDALTLTATLADGTALPGWLVFDAVAGSFSGTPPQDFNGILSVTVTASDGSLAESGTFALEITPVNDAPVATDDVAQSATLIAENVVTSIETATLLANDGDVEGDALTVTAVSATSTHGAALTLNTDGTISYDPRDAEAVRDLERDQTLTDTFTYTVDDGHGGESTATVSLEVIGANDAPDLIAPLPPKSSAEDEAVSFTLPENAFTDPNGDALTLTATLADGSALPDWLVFDAVAARFSGIPPQDFNGTLNVMVTAGDGSLSTSETFTLEITPVNDAPVAADDSVGANELLVNEFTNTAQKAPSITALANGNFVVTWDSRDGQQGDPSDSAIKARIFNAEGVEIVSEFLVNEFTDSWQLISSVTALANGHFVVTWSSRDQQQGDPSGYAVKARVFDADGAEIVSEFVVNEFTDDSQFNSSVTALANGHFVITWESEDQQQGDTSPTAIKARIFDAAGVEIVSEFVVNEFTDYDQRNPSVTALENGKFVVTWQSYAVQQGDPSGYAVKARIFDADGDEIVSEFLVNEFTYHSQWVPSVAELANGHFVVTWESHDGQHGDTDWAIKARIFDANGAEIVSEFLVNEFTNNGQHDPSVTAFANGNFVVTWQSYDGLQGDASSAIKARIFDANGVEIVSEFLVNEFTDGNQNTPSVTALANGGFVVTWESLDGQQGDTSDYAIKARIFDANGVAQGPMPITEDVVTSIDTATLLANDSDVDGDALTVTAVSATSTHGAALVLNTDGTISYDPRDADAVQALERDQTLIDTITYTVEDGNGGESTASVSIVVRGTNDAPVVSIPLPNQSSAEDETVSFALPADAFIDPNGDALTLSATLADGTALPDWLVFDAVTESFSGTPPQDFNGTLNVMVTASDGSLSSSSTFALEITPVNDAPEDLTLTGSEVQEHDAGAVIGMLSVSDPDVGDTFTYTVDDDRFEVLGNTLKLKDGESLDYESETQVVLTVTATDSGDLSTSKTFALDVGDVYDPVVNVTVVRDATSTVATLSGTMDYYTMSTDNGLIEVNALGGGATVGGADTFRFEDDGGEFTIRLEAEQRVSDNLGTDTISAFARSTALVNGGYVVTWTSSQADA
ncbi:tandem-95 repeat protein, partial [Yoonia sp. R2-816]|uniref:tandem-95 repeat protein n=1 Tax=Yoonia sp. R2-816 TaxID=3342638 RepID=UPI00372969F0